jgi:hypothetical protein
VNHRIPTRRRSSLIVVGGWQRDMRRVHFRTGNGGVHYSEPQVFPQLPAVHTLGHAADGAVTVSALAEPPRWFDPWKWPDALP